MRRHHDRRAARFQSRDHIIDEIEPGRIKRAVRLIEQHHPRLLQQHARE
jgi:hypothetical protein